MFYCLDSVLFTKHKEKQEDYLSTYKITQISV